MSMMEYLEKDKEAFLRKLQDAGSTEKAELVVRDEFDRLLVLYNEDCEEQLRRDVAAVLMQNAKLSSGLVDSVGETKILEVLSSAGREKTEKSWKQKLFFGAGAASGIFSVLSTVLARTGDSLKITDVIAAVVLMTIAILCGWLAGKETGGKKGSVLPSNYQTENKIDPNHIYTCIHNMMFAADQDLNRLELPDLSNTGLQAKGSVGNLPLPLIDLFSELLEALYCEDGEFALDKIGNVKYYLHQNGIEVVAFDGTNKEFFDFMPAVKAGTFRPALVSDGKVLKRGLASGGR